MSAKHIAAQCFEDREMDTELATVFAEKLHEHSMKPRLGLATTEHLLTELMARAQVDGNELVVIAIRMLHHKYTPSELGYQTHQENVDATLSNF